MTDPSRSAGVHRASVRVYYEDTDAGGIVYYANYLKFIERARSELLRRLGIESSQLMRDHGIAFAVKRCTVDYKSPAVLDDELNIETRIIRVGGASLELCQQVWRGDEQLVSVDIKLGSLELSKGKPKAMPPDVRVILDDFYRSAPNKKE